MSNDNEKADPVADVDRLAAAWEERRPLKGDLADRWAERVQIEREKAAAPEDARPLERRSFDPGKP